MSGQVSRGSACEYQADEQACCVSDVQHDDSLGVLFLFFPYFIKATTTLGIIPYVVV